MGITEAASTQCIGQLQEEIRLSTRQNRFLDRHHVSCKCCRGAVLQSQQH